MNIQEEAQTFKFVLEASSILEKVYFPIFSSKETGIRQFIKNDFVIMISHRWQERDSPDPKNEQAQIVKVFLEAASKAAYNKTLIKHLNSCIWNGFRSGIEAIHSAEPFIGKHNWLRLNDFACVHLFWALVQRIHANRIQNISEFSDIVLFYDWSCLPQNSSGDERLHKQFVLGLEWMTSSLPYWPTLALFNDDYADRGWCVVEAASARNGLYGTIVLPMSKNLELPWQNHPLRNSLFLRATVKTVHPSDILNEWKDRNIQCTNGSDLNLLANMSYPLFGNQLGDNGRLIYRFWFLVRHSWLLLPALLLHPFHLPTEVILFTSIIMLCIIYNVNSMSYRLRASPMAISSRFHHYNAVKSGALVLKALCAATAISVILCSKKECQKGCLVCMTKLTQSLPKISTNNIQTTKFASISILADNSSCLFSFYYRNTV